jgi:hypothetical protein
LCIEWLCTQKRWNPYIANIFGATARYRRATVDSSHDGAHPDNSALHTGKIYSFPLHISRFVLLLLRMRRGRRGNDLGTTIKYLKKTTSGATGIGLGTTIKNP